jgi:hypothetical protein
MVGVDRGRLRPIPGSLAPSGLLHRIVVIRIDSLSCLYLPDQWKPSLVTHGSLMFRAVGETGHSAADRGPQEGSGARACAVARGRGASTDPAGDDLHG